MVGLYLLSKLAENKNVDIKSNDGLYRADGLIAIIGNKRTLEQTKRAIIKIFKSENLKIDEDIIVCKTI